MRRKLKLKSFVLPVVYSVLLITLLAVALLNRNVLQKEKDDDTTYVSGSILDSYVPVINMENTIIRPYTNQDIKIGKDFYRYEDEESNQTNSIIFYENTYMQNSGIDYTSENPFEVVSILDGEVLEVKKEELLGYSVTIRHSNDIISVYQSLSEVSVENKEQVIKGQVIGKSGSSELNKDLKNCLHFEMIIKGQTKDPEEYFDKKVSEILE